MKGLLILDILFKIKQFLILFTNKTREIALVSFSLVRSFFHRFAKLPRYLSKTEKRFILGLFFVIFISTILLIRDQFLIEKITVPNFGGVYLEGQVGEIKSLLPILSQNEVEKDISKLVFSSLVKYNGKREVIPDLAEKWEIGQDGKTYTFYLKEAKWHDGEKVTADDLIFTFSLTQDEKTKSPFFESFQGVEVKKIDDKTIQFILQTPCAPFLSNLTISILPKHLLEKISPSDLLDSQFIKKPIGSGPFRLEKIEKNKEGFSVTLVAFSDYFKKPFLSKIIFKVYPQKEDLQKAFGGKEILGFLNSEVKEKSYKIVLPQYEAIFFNLDSVFSDKSLRKALAYATNKEEIIKAAQKAERVDFPILPGFLGYKESRKWEFNPEEAKKILEKFKEPVEIELLTNQSENHQKIAEILKEQWEAVGVGVALRIETNAYFEQAIFDRDYDALLIGENLKADPDPYPFWHSSFASGPGLNLSSFESKRVDKLLEGARQTLDQNLRKEKYEKFVDIIQEEVPAIFLYQPIYYYQISDIIKGLEDVQGVTKSERFWNIENWYIKTKKIKKEKES